MPPLIIAVIFIEVKRAILPLRFFLALLEAWRLSLKPLMHYREIKPGLALSRFIKCYWVLEDDSPTTLSQTIVPDGRTELLINLSAPFQQEKNRESQTKP
jgi:hypothetical protein